jgi:hypothetical protein
MADYLLARGADLNGTPSWGEDTPFDVAESVDTGPGAGDLGARARRQEIVGGRNLSRVETHGEAVAAAGAPATRHGNRTPKRAQP